MWPNPWKMFFIHSKMCRKYNLCCLENCYNYFQTWTWAQSYVSPQQNVHFYNKYNMIKFMRKYVNSKHTSRQSCKVTHAIWLLDIVVTNITSCCKHNVPNHYNLFKNAHFQFLHTYMIYVWASFSKEITKKTKQKHEGWSNNF